MSQNYPTPTQGQPEPAGYPQPVRMPAFRPLVTYTLIGICVAAYALQMFGQYYLGGDFLGELGAKVNGEIVKGQLWRLFTPMFLHGSPLHLLFNMYALFNIGVTLERFYGRWRYLGLFVVSGFAGNVLSFMFSTKSSWGSSTAIFGLLGAEGVFIFQNRTLFGHIARRALSQVVMVAAVNLIIGLSPGIDNWGHVGGLVGGTLIAWFGGPLLQRAGDVPPYHLVDQRSQRDALLAGLAVAGLFVFLTGAALFIAGS